MNTAHFCRDRFRDSLPILATFLVLAVGFYALGYWLIFRLERAAPLMMSVGLAAVVTCLIFGRPLSSLGLSWGKSRYHYLAYLIPLGIAAVSYVIIWSFGLGVFDASFVADKKAAYNLPLWGETSIVLFHFLLSASFTLCMSLPSILGEEIAWRGFLVSELSKSMSFTTMVLVIGLLWSVFHWPLMFKGFYGSEFTPLWWQMACFTLFIIANTCTMIYLRLKTNSVWTAVWFHASSNVFIQKVFTPATLIDADSSWYIDEFGLVVPLVAAAVAFYFWRRAVAMGFK